MKKINHLFFIYLLLGPYELNLLIYINLESNCRNALLENDQMII